VKSDDELEFLIMILQERYFEAACLVNRKLPKWSGHRRDAMSRIIIAAIEHGDMVAAEDILQSFQESLTAETVGRILAHLPVLEEDPDRYPEPVHRKLRLIGGRGG
jgi:hypothetical protein